MAKRKTPKVQDLRPDSITKEELQKLQNVVKIINEAQLQIGMLESQKHAMLHDITGAQQMVNSIRQELIEKYGTDYFKKIDIWDLDFIPYKEINDPRSILDRMVHKWLIGTIKQRRAVLTRVIDKLLKKVW